MRIPASIQTLEFATDNANINFQGIGIEGFACWQINPEDPVQAIRHLIANMTIEDAHRKKEEIAADLKKQLTQIETTWGIIFHQVGIRNVKVMSESLFNDLQAKYRNAQRLESARTKIDADKKIATEDNARIDQSETEKLESAQKLAKLKLDSRSKHREEELKQEQVISQKEYETEVHKKNLEIKLKSEQEKSLLEITREIETLKQQIAAVELEIRRSARVVDQTFSDDALTQQLLAVVKSSNIGDLLKPRPDKENS